jgi:hypothetical protein
MAWQTTLLCRYIGGSIYVFKGLQSENLECGKSHLFAIILMSLMLM